MDYSDMPSMKKSWEALNYEVAQYGAELIAVSKTKPIETVQQVYDFGQRDFGENRVQELLSKKPQLPDNIRWHHIGQLQTNKVKDLMGNCHLIHGVDRWKLVHKINEESIKSGIQTSILIQIKIAEEANKSGYEFSNLIKEIDSGLWNDLPGITIQGVMGMATFTKDEKKVRKEFKVLRKHFGKLKSIAFSKNKHFVELSMGMSGDYKIALDEGATLVRIGSLVFGGRSY